MMYILKCKKTCRYLIIKPLFIFVNKIGSSFHNSILFNIFCKKLINKVIYVLSCRLCSNNSPTIIICISIDKTSATKGN